MGLRSTLFNQLSHPSLHLKQELSVSDTTFKVFVLLEGIEPSFHSYQECVLTILLQEQFTPLHRLNGPAAIWEWGFPVISGLRGTGWNRTNDTLGFNQVLYPWATVPAPVYLCKGGGSTDTIIPLFCSPGWTRTTINWLTVNRNNLYTTEEFLTTTIFTAKWLVVVQGCRSSSLHLGFCLLDSGILRL